MFEHNQTYDATIVFVNAQLIVVYFLQYTI